MGLHINCWASLHSMRYLVVLVLVLAAGLVSAQANYRKSAEIPPLRVSFSALQGVLDKTEKLAASANAGNAPRREEIVLTADTLKVTIPGRTLTPNNAKVPERIDSLTYTYSMVTEAPISRVEFDFSDYRRTLTVEGNSPEHVDAVFAAIREDLMHLSSALGGTGIKMFFGFPAYWFC
jgi:hypothetical protein